ncbi:hypothetical protein [uncultured Veillonella sp.]|uniref:hypothetical protein n=1 Tax=uncultured Veillonella sp. TaxID=159268 RepID=UPI0028DCE13E|nr:hypothetical protein [uncultured Veillonella sp.]
MFENIVIGLFGLLMVNYLVIIAKQRIVKIVICILGNCFFGLSLFSDYIALPSYMIDLKYILIIIFCIACIFDLWQRNRASTITAGDKRVYDTFIGRIKFIVIFFLLLCGVASVIHYFG